MVRMSNVIRRGRFQSIVELLALPGQDFSGALQNSCQLLEERAMFRIIQGMRHSCTDVYISMAQEERMVEHTGAASTESVKNAF